MAPQFFVFTGGRRTTASFCRSSRPSNSYRFIGQILRGYADSDKPYTDYLPATIAQDMLELAAVEGTDRFHILSHDLGGPPSVALAYMAGERVDDCLITSWDLSHD